MLTEEELRSIFTSLLQQHKINLIIDPEDYEISKAITGTVALDVEHNEAGEFVGCGLALTGSNTVLYYSSLRTLNRVDFHPLSIVAHNGISDFECLRQWGIDIKDEQLVHDTLLIAHIQDSSLKAYGLKDMAKRELGITYPSYEDLVGKKSAKERRTLDKLPVDVVAAYNSLDTFCTWKLYERQMECITR